MTSLRSESAAELCNRLFEAIKELDAAGFSFRDRHIHPPFREVLDSEDSHCVFVSTVPWPWTANDNQSLIDASTKELPRLQEMCFEVERICERLRPIIQKAAGSVGSDHRAYGDLLNFLHELRNFKEIYIPRKRVKLAEWQRGYPPCERNSKAYDWPGQPMMHRLGGVAMEAVELYLAAAKEPVTAGDRRRIKGHYANRELTLKQCDADWTETQRQLEPWANGDNSIKPRDDDPLKHDPLGRAMMLIKNDPALTNSQIAKAVGVHIKTLNKERWRLFRTLRDSMRNGQAPPSGSKSKDGDIEAWEKE